MANPNIVNVTSIYGESIGEALTTTVTTDIMTVASNKLYQEGSLYEKENIFIVLNRDRHMAK